MCGKIKEWFHDQKMTIKAELKSVTIRAAFIGAGLSFLISIISIAVASCISLDANNIARNAQKYVEKEFAIQFTSNLGAYIDHRNFYVGDGKPFQRIDNFIQIPLVIYNKNYGLATDIELTLIFNDGDRDLGPINEIIP
ncbi:MAG: hypothetical protein NTY47_04810, partial [Candidatus Omnitrophica bacterium]|nr:hypothetical protein [Candidatus Omnitrophota bacterium]